MASTADLVTESVQDLTEKDAPPTGTKYKRMTLRERATYYKELITIEPLLCGYLMASVLCLPALANLEFEKACRSNFEYNDTVCEAILTGEHDNYTEQNDNIQEVLAEMHSWQQPMQNIMPIILVLFLGSYSDRHKIRKPFLLLPIMGEFLAVAGCILCVIFMRQWPVQVLGVMQTVVPSFFGGPTMIVMAAFAYIADVSTLEMRTLRMGVVQIVLSAWTPIVQSFSGILFYYIGYIGILLIGGVFYLGALCYGLFWIKEPKKPVDLDVTDKKGLIADICNTRHAIDTFMIVLRKKKGVNRLNIVLIMVILMVYSGVASGEFSVFFFYTQKVFKWTPVEFSYFVTLNNVVHLVGTILAVPLFTKFFSLHDLTIAQLSFFDKVLCNLIFLVQSTTALYIGSVVSLITAIANIAIRSQATKVVSEDDLGKTQSLFAIVEAIAPTVAIPLYNEGVYVNTLKVFVGAFLLLGIGGHLFGMVILAWMYIAEKRNPRAVQPANNVEVVNRIELDIPKDAENGKKLSPDETTHI